MAKGYLITLPAHDEVVHYLSTWCKQTIDVAKEHNFNVIPLEETKANIHDFKSYITKNKVDLIVFNGHGDPFTIYGHLDKPLITPENKELLKGKIIYAISCSCSKELGPSCISTGTFCFIGYDENFTFYREIYMATTPLRDPLAEMYLSHAVIFINSLLKGNSVDHAFQNAKENLKANLIKSYSQGDPDVSKYLWWDMVHFVYHGNPNAQLV